MQARTSTWYVRAVGHAADVRGRGRTGRRPGAAVQPVLVVIDAGNDGAPAQVEGTVAGSHRKVGDAGWPAERRDAHPVGGRALAPVLRAITENVNGSSPATGTDLDVKPASPEANSALLSSSR